MSSIHGLGRESTALILSVFFKKNESSMSKTLKTKKPLGRVRRSDRGEPDALIARWSKSGGDPLGRPRARPYALLWAAKGRQAC
jgi:hypothetical protein